MSANEFVSVSWRWLSGVLLAAALGLTGMVYNSLAAEVSKNSEVRENIGSIDQRLLSMERKVEQTDKKVDKIYDLLLSRPHYPPSAVAPYNNDPRPNVGRD